MKLVKVVNSVLRPNVDKWSFACFSSWSHFRLGPRNTPFHGGAGGFESPRGRHLAVGGSCSPRFGVRGGIYPGGRRPCHAGGRGFGPFRSAPICNATS